MKFQFEHHSDDDSLELYALGRLDEAKTEILEEHMLICEHCRVRLDKTENYVNAMRSGTARLRRDQEEKGSATAALLPVWNLFKMPALGWMGVAVTVFVVTIALPRPAQNSGVLTVALVAERGESMSAPAHRKLDLQMDARGLDLGPKARVEVVDDRGGTMETITAPEVAERIDARTTRELKPGSYYVRLYAPGSREMVREFGLDVR